MIGYVYTVEIQVEGDWYHTDPGKIAMVVRDAIREDCNGEATVGVDVVDEAWMGPKGS